MLAALAESSQPGPRPKDLHTQLPKSRPLSEKSEELIRKRRIKHVFGSFNKGPFKRKRAVFVIEPGHDSLKSRHVHR